MLFMETSTRLLASCTHLFLHFCVECQLDVPLQVRKGKKHTAEYKADKPLCGTWAEIDGRMKTLLLLHPDPSSSLLLSIYMFSHV